VFYARQMQAVQLQEKRVRLLAVVKLSGYPVNKNCFRQLRLAYEDSTPMAYIHVGGLVSQGGGPITAYRQADRKHAHTSVLRLRSQRIKMAEFNQTAALCCC